MTLAYYNEIEPFAADWIERLAQKRLIANGIVDRRSIADVAPNDIKASRAHFFAGIGGWDYALQLAGWPDDAPVWTGSCPCQPFSAAGKQKGFEDERHLWPEWFRLIHECRPPVVLGEQVASPDGLAWLDAVSSDLEGAGYAVGAADLCAAGVGAPHLRQRLYFMAIAESARLEGRPLAEREQSTQPVGLFSPRSSDDARSGPTFWDDAEWIDCRDGKRRPIEPGPQQMADGFSESLGRLRTGTINQIEKGIANASISESHAREMLSGLWQETATAAIQRPSRRLHMLHEAPILLAFLRELKREGWHLLNHLPPSCWKTPESGLREMRARALETSRPSQGRNTSEQRDTQPTDPMPVMSQIMARALMSTWAIPHPLAHGLPGRVGRLRGYGNAIVPQVAAAFIRAVWP